MNPLASIRSVVDRFRVVLALPLLAAASLLSSCTPPNPFLDEGVPPAESLPINSFQQQWSAQIETLHGPITRVIARDTMIFGLTEDGTSYVVDRAKGTILHAETIRHGDEILHPPVVLKDFIVYPTNTALEIYDKKGILLHSKELSYAIRSDCVGSKSSVYFGADFIGGGRLIAVDVNSEFVDHRWELMFPGASVSSAPTVLGDIVYVAAKNGDVTAVAYDSREPIWSLPNGMFHTYDPVVADLAADESGVYVASTDTKLCCLNRNNGKVKWQYNANSSLLKAPFVTKTMVYQPVPGVGIVALDKLAGSFNRTPKWIAPDVVKVLAEDEKYTYVLRGDKTVLALDRPTGSAMFTAKRRDLTAFAANNKDGTIFTVTTGNRMMAIIPVLKPGVVGEMAWAPVPATGAGQAPTLALAR